MIISFFQNFNYLLSSLCYHYQFRAVDQKYIRFFFNISWYMDLTFAIQALSKHFYLHTNKYPWNRRNRINTSN